MRQRSEVYIVKDRKLIVGVNSKGRINFPGGEIDQGEIPKKAAERETLEEIGVQVKNLRELPPYEFNYIKEIGPWEKLPESITRWNEIGMKTYPFIGEFEKENRKIFNSAGDGRKFILLNSDQIIQELNKFNEQYYKIRVRHQIKIVQNLKRKKIID